MFEAAKTTATAGEIWVICVVMVICLAFWLSMVAWADKNPVHRGREQPDMNVPWAESGRARVPGVPGQRVSEADEPELLRGGQVDEGG